METFDFYHGNTPELLKELADTQEMQRLKNVGMNCGCEYTSFPLFSGIGSYSRFTHSMGVGLITFHFTEDLASAAAALLHDIATPVFAHTVDFLNGDNILQESTESRTGAVIAGSEEICAVLRKYGLTPEDVSDYHRCPIADNASPRLSADRLEYTLGNGVNYGFVSFDEAKALYADLCAGTNEDGEPELCFSDFSCAEHFAFLALDCSKIYVSPEDRYAMQMLSELLREALDLGAILPGDLEGDEPGVIRKFIADECMKIKWKDFQSLSTMVPVEIFPEAARVIPAKKRRIDPLLAGAGRMSAVSPRFRSALEEYMHWDFRLPVAGK